MLNNRKKSRHINQLSNIESKLNSSRLKPINALYAHFFCWLTSCFPNIIFSSTSIPRLKRTNLDMLEDEESDVM